MFQSQVGAPLLVPALRLRTQQQLMPVTCLGTMDCCWIGTLAESLPCSVHAYHEPSTGAGKIMKDQFADKTDGLVIPFEIFFEYRQEGHFHLFCSGAD